MLGGVGGCVVLVLAFFFAGPRLQEATMALAPDAPPVDVASGDIDGASWSVTAVEPEDEEPCARVEVDGTEARMVCGGRRGPSNVRALDAVEVGGGVVVVTITDPRSEEVRISHDQTMTAADVVYADYGFPMGFAATEVSAPVHAITLYGDEGSERGRADCTLDGDDHDPDRHLAPPIMVGTGAALSDGCLLTD